MSEGAENFYQLIRIIVDLGKEVLLKLLKENVPAGQTLESFLKNKKSIINSLEKRKLLNELQLKVLKEAKPDGTKFDISLLFTLIRNITSLQPPNLGWDAKIIPAGDQSAGALLIRIKNVRNEVIHKGEPCLTQTEFLKLWKEMEVCLLGLAAEISSTFKQDVKNKITELRNKPFKSEEKDKVDFVWHKEKISDMMAKLEEIREKVDRNADVSSELLSMRSSIDSMSNEIKTLKTQATGNLKSFPFQTCSQMSSGSAGADSSVSDRGNTSQDQSMVVSEIDNMKRYVYNCMMYMCYGNFGPEGLDTTDGGTTYTNPNALSDDEIRDYAEELGSDWEIFAIYLGYKQTQIDILKDTYVRQIETLLLTMLQKWHDIVARCEDENPKDLLAAAFTGIRDNLTASKILGGRERLQEVKRMKPKPKTAEKIRKIKFATRPTMPFAAMLQISASMSSGPSAIGYGNMNQNSALSSGTSNQQQILPPAPGNETNICRGEGVGDSMDYVSTSTTSSNSSAQFKKTDDDTFTQNAIGTLHEYMKSVGSIIITYGNKGTCFRVGEKYIITALHVVEALPDDMYGNDIQIDPTYAVPAIFLNFNENPDVPPQTIYRLKPPCYKDSKLDIAVIEIANCDHYLPRGLPFGCFEDPKYKVDIIGYGHPNSNKKHLDPNCDVYQVNHNKVVLARFKLEQEKHALQTLLKLAGKDWQLVQRAFDGFDDPSHFLLDCLFEHGASGAPAIDHSTPNLLKVVGVYTRGFPSFFFDLPKDRQRMYESLRFEMCSKSSCLFQNMKAYNELLADEIFGKNVTE